MEYVCMYVRTYARMYVCMYVRVMYVMCIPVSGKCNVEPSPLECDAMCPQTFRRQTVHPSSGV